MLGGMVSLCSFAMCLRAISEYRKRSPQNAAMPLVMREDVRTPLRAFRIVFGIGHFDNQINFEAPTIRPTLAERRRGHRPRSPKSAHIARFIFRVPGDAKIQTTKRSSASAGSKLRVTGSLTPIVGGHPCRTQLLLKKAARRLSPVSGNRMTHFAEGCE